MHRNISDSTQDSFKSSSANFSGTPSFHNLHAYSNSKQLITFFANIELLTRFSIDKVTNMSNKINALAWQEATPVFHATHNFQQ